MKLSSEMAGRAFRVKIQLDIHAITCPGVWLCPNGKVALQINTLGSCVETRRISPVLPLLFHDTFIFSKVFSQIVSLTELQYKLGQESLYAKLLQRATPGNRGITLATFETNLVDLLYPAPCFKGLLAGVDIDLLMEPTKCFPGIIAPKIEVSTKTIIEEVLSICDTSVNKCHVVNPKLINSKQTACNQRKRTVKGIIRQRKVCHTKSHSRSQSCRPYRQRSSSVDDSFHGHSCITNHRAGIDQCYHAKKDCVSRPCFHKPFKATTICDNIHVTDNCPVCLKYNCYFAKCHDDMDKKYVAPKHRYNSHSYKNLCDSKGCCCVCKSSASSDTQEERTSLLQSKARNVQKTREKLCFAKTAANNITMCHPNYENNQDYSNQGFYKNLEKFYKRMYKHAKIRAQEVET